MKETIYLALYAAAAAYFAIQIAYASTLAYSIKKNIGLININEKLFKPSFYIKAMNINAFLAYIITSIVIIYGWIGKLLNCPYCISFYLMLYPVSKIAAYYSLSTFDVIIMSCIAMPFITLYEGISIKK